MVVLAMAVVGVGLLNFAEAAVPVRKHTFSHTDGVLTDGAKISSSTQNETSLSPGLVRKRVMASGDIENIPVQFVDLSPPLSQTLVRNSKLKGRVQREDKESVGDFSALSQQGLDDDQYQAEEVLVDLGNSSNASYQHVTRKEVIPDDNLDPYRVFHDAQVSPSPAAVRKRVMANGNIESIPEQLFDSSVLSSPSIVRDSKSKKSAKGNDLPSEVSEMQTSGHEGANQASDIQEALYVGLEQMKAEMRLETTKLQAKWDVERAELESKLDAERAETADVKAKLDAMLQEEVRPSMEETTMMSHMDQSSMSQVMETMGGTYKSKTKEETAAESVWGEEPQEPANDASGTAPPPLNRQNAAGGLIGSGSARPTLVRQNAARDLIGLANAQPSTMSKIAGAMNRGWKSDSGKKMRGALGKGVGNMLVAAVSGGDMLAATKNLAITMTTTAIEEFLPAIPFVGAVASTFVTFLGGLIGGGGGNALEALYKKIMAEVKILINKAQLEALVSDVRGELDALSGEVAWVPDMLNSADHHIKLSYFLVLQDNCAMLKPKAFGRCKFEQSQNNDLCKSFREQGGYHLGLRFASLHLGIMVEIARLDPNIYPAMMDRVFEVGWQYALHLKDSFAVYETYRTTAPMLDEDYDIKWSCPGDRAQKVNRFRCIDKFVGETLQGGPPKEYRQYCHTRRRDVDFSRRRWANGSEFIAACKQYHEDIKREVSDAKNSYLEMTGPITGVAQCSSRTLRSSSTSSLVLVNSSSTAKASDVDSTSWGLDSSSQSSSYSSSYSPRRRATNSCQTGYEPIPNDLGCWYTAHALGYTYMGTENNASRPKGCYKLTMEDAGFTFGGIAYFNKHPVGAAMQGAEQICKPGPTNAPTEEPTSSPTPTPPLKVAEFEYVNSAGATPPEKLGACQGNCMTDSDCQEHLRCLSGPSAACEGSREEGFYRYCYPDTAVCDTINNAGGGYKVYHCRKASWCELTYNIADMQVCSDDDLRAATCG